MARWAMAKATLRKLYSDKEQNVGTRIAFIQPEQQNNICFACCWSTTVQTGTYYYIIMFTQYCWKVMMFRRHLNLAKINKTNKLHIECQFGYTITVLV